MHNNMTLAEKYRFLGCILLFGLACPTLTGRAHDGEIIVIPMLLMLGCNVLSDSFQYLRRQIRKGKGN